MDKYSKIVVVSLMLTGMSSAYAGAEMQPGMWELTTRMEMQGMPAMPGGNEFKFKQCIDNKNMVPQNKQNPQQSHCKMLEQKVKGNSVSWKMECQQGMALQGEVTYSGDSMNGVMNMQMNAQGMAMNMKQVISGNRVGDCNSR